MSSPPPDSDTADAYGTGDASFRAAGGEAGITALVNRFYDIMATHPDAQAIRNMHPEELAGSRDRLARFLCGWLGGPKRYHERYGNISIPRVHAHLQIGPDHRDAWLMCMQLAVDEQPWAATFKAYLLRQLAVPANRITNMH